jgi:hypothetical protein
MSFRKNFVEPSKFSVWTDLLKTLKVLRLVLPAGKSWHSTPFSNQNVTYRDVAFL